MSKNIIWYSIEDGSCGACKDTDLIIIETANMTAEDAQALYQADADGDRQEFEDAIIGVYNRHNPEKIPCG